MSVDTKGSSQMLLMSTDMLSVRACECVCLTLPETTPVTQRSLLPNDIPRNVTVPPPESGTLPTTSLITGGSYENEVLAAVPLKTADSVSATCRHSSECRGCAV